MALPPRGSRPHGCAQPGEQHASPRIPQGSFGATLSRGRGGGQRRSVSHAQSGAAAVIRGWHRPPRCHLSRPLRGIGSVQPRAGDTEGESSTAGPPSHPRGGTRAAAHPHHPQRDRERGSAAPSTADVLRRRGGRASFYVAPPAPTPAPGETEATFLLYFPQVTANSRFPKVTRWLRQRGSGAVGRGGGGTRPPPAPCRDSKQALPPPRSLWPCSFRRRRIKGPAALISPYQPRQCLFARPHALPMSRQGRWGQGGRGQPLPAPPLQQPEAQQHEERSRPPPPRAPPASVSPPRGGGHPIMGHSAPQ